MEQWSAPMWSRRDFLHARLDRSMDRPELRSVTGRCHDGHPGVPDPRGVWRVVRDRCSDHVARKLHGSLWFGMDPVWARRRPAPPDGLCYTIGRIRGRYV